MPYVSRSCVSSKCLEINISAIVMEVGDIYAVQQDTQSDFNV